jgi:hypothetical protein
MELHWSAAILGTSCALKAALPRSSWLHTEVTAMGSDSQRTFYARAARFDLKTPLLFRLPEGIVKGRSINVSETGMLAVFEQRMDLWATGRLSTATEDSHVDLDVRVARADGREAGLNFQIASEDDRIAIQKLIAYAILKGAPPYGDMPPEPPATELP